MEDYHLWNLTPFCFAFARSVLIVTDPFGLHGFITTGLTGKHGYTTPAGDGEMRNSCVKKEPQRPVLFKQSIR